jgi:uncharacterized membrane protein YcaP (DUF421 family)
MRLMGKRQIGEMQPSELVVTFMISELASLPAQSINIPILAGVVPIFTLVAVEIIISFISLKSRKAREIISGKPNLIIKDGKINYKEMEKLRMNMDDLLEELRLKDIKKIKHVKTAIVETNGKLSIES